MCVCHPEYVLVSNTEVSGKEKLENPFSEEIEEENYILSSNELWKIYFLNSAESY